MKRDAVIKKLRKAAKSAGIEYEQWEGTRHTRIRIGDTVSQLGRHSEVPDHTARKFFEQYASELGKGWWR